MNLMEIGKFVKVARKEAKLKQSTLAEASGLTRETLNRLEQGRLQEFGFEKLGRIMSVLKLELRPQKQGSAGNLNDLKREVMK